MGVVCVEESVKPQRYGKCLFTVQNILHLGYSYPRCGCVCISVCGAVRLKTVYVLLFICTPTKE